MACPGTTVARLAGRRLAMDELREFLEDEAKDWEAQREQAGDAGGQARNGVTYYAANRAAQGFRRALLLLDRVEAQADG